MTGHLWSGKRRVVAVLEDPATLHALRRLWSEDVSGWELLVVPEPEAERLLMSSRRLKRDLDFPEGSLVPKSLDRFNQLVNDVLPAPAADDRTVVMSRWPVPLDLVKDDNGDWGERGIFSHVLLPEDSSLEVLHRSISDPGPAPIGTYLLVCPMAMDRFVPRHKQDIVRVATELEKYLPIELWLQPSLDRALQAFEQPHVGVLHIDTHGSATTVMMGPTRDGGRQIAPDRLPALISKPLVIVVGCELTGSADGIGAELVRRGVTATFGSFIRFRSLAITGSEETEADWYRCLLKQLINGDDLGHAVLAARRGVAAGIQRYCWLTLGSSFLRFDTGIAPHGRS
jgi:hypothetical protein